MHYVRKCGFYKRMTRVHTGQSRLGRSMGIGLPPTSSEFRETRGYLVLRAVMSLAKVIMHDGPEGDVFLGSTNN